MILRRCIRLGEKPRTSLAVLPKRALSHVANVGSIYDVVCVGGGPAGLSLVTALKSSKITSSLKVALIESQNLSDNIDKQAKTSTTSYSNRCVSLTPASIDFLDEIQAWKYVDRKRVQPYHHMKVWDGITGSRITFDWDGNTSSPTESKGREIASMIENTNITSALLQRAKELGDISVFDNIRVNNIELGQDTEEVDLSTWPILSLSNGTTLAARLLVGADGPNSLVRKFAGIESRGWDYERNGVVATLQLEPKASTEAAAVAYQRFLPSGPIAMLPLPNGFASLVWSTTPSNAALLRSLSSEDFIAMVNAAFRLSKVDLEYMHTLGNGQVDEFDWRIKHTQFDQNLVPPIVKGLQTNSIAAFPLRMRHADTYTGERVALAGDAAHTIHPLAGQGLNQGQADVQVLVSAIEDAVVHGQDIGSQLALEPYNAKRYAANNMLLGVVDKLHKIYSVSSGPLVPLRSMGLSAVNALAPLKAFLMGQASSTGRSI